MATCYWFLYRSFLFEGSCSPSRSVVEKKWEVFIQFALLVGDEYIFGSELILCDHELNHLLKRIEAYFLLFNSLLLVQVHL